MLLARPTASKLLIRACIMRSPFDHDALAALRSVSCTSVQPSAAERRLMLTGVNAFSDLHTSFPIDPEVIHQKSWRIFTQLFVYDTMAHLDHLDHLANIA